MATPLLKDRYGITRTFTTGELSQGYLAEDLQRPGNPCCYLQEFSLNASHPALLKVARQIFVKEVKRLTILGEHPQIPTLQGAFELEGKYYLVQDWIKGRSLASQLSDGPKSEGETIQILQQTLQILGFVHDQGMMHRNLSLESWLWTDQQWMLCEFGGCTQISLLQLNGQGQVGLRRPLGQPPYRPAHWQAKPTVHFDLYAMGVIGVQLLMGAEAAPDQDWPGDCGDGCAVAERLCTVLQGLLNRRYATATEALQWLRGTAVTMATPGDEPPHSPTVISQPNSQPHPTVISQPNANAQPQPIPIDSPRPTFGLLAQRYRILRQLGDGGFGQTFLATDEQFPGQPQCVVKQLRPYRATPQTLKLARRLFFSEAEVLSKLGEHPQIPHLLAYFEENDEFYLVQEYIEGADIEAELTAGKTWSEVKVIRLLQEVLAILEFVHSQNVIHRDLKPANIRRRTTGELVLIDFGAVKQIGEPGMKPDKTKVTVAIGTPGYAPSEQTQGKPRFSSDLYALGMIAIQALTGIEPEHLPEDPKTGEVIWHDRIGQKNLNPLLREVIDRMVRYDFRQRYPDAAAVLADLTALGSRRATVLRPIQQLNRQRVHPVVAIALIAGLIIAIFAGVVQHLVRQMALDAASLQPTTISPAVSPQEDGDQPLPPLIGQTTALNVAVTAAAYNANLNRLVMVAANPNQLYVYSLLSQRLQGIPLGDVPRQVVVDSAGQRAAVVHEQRITVVNLQRNQVERVIDTPTAIATVVITANGWIYHSGADDDHLFAINMATGASTVQRNVPNLMRSMLTLHPNGRTLLALAQQGTLIQVVDLNGADTVAVGEWQAPEGQNLGDRLWISPDGQQAITNQGYRFSLPSFRGSQTLQTQRLPLENVTAPAGDRFASADRLAFASNQGQIFALDGVPLQKLLQIDSPTLTLSQTWQIPSQEATLWVGRHLFINPRNQEYYLLTQPQGGGPTLLWSGTLAP